jgi:hypothetical protein
MAVNDDIFKGLFAGKQRRQHDAVIIDARLRAKNGDAVFPGIARKNLLYRTAPCHAITDDNQMRARSWIKHY